MDLDANLDGLTDDRLARSIVFYTKVLDLIGEVLQSGGMMEGHFDYVDLFAHASARAHEGLPCPDDRDDCIHTTCALAFSTALHLGGKLVLSVDGEAYAKIGDVHHIATCARSALMIEQEQRKRRHFGLDSVVYN